MPDHQYRSLFTNYDSPPLMNIGCCEDQTIRELAELVKNVVGFDGKHVFDTTKPDGTPPKLLDSSRLLALGWQPQTKMKDGLLKAYGDYQS